LSLSKYAYRSPAPIHDQHRLNLDQTSRSVAVAEAKLSGINRVERTAHGERAFTNWVQARVQRLTSEADFCDVISFMAEVQTLEIINDLRYRR
jgi:hypothetical protein